MRLARIAAEIARLDRKGAAFAFDHRRIAEQGRDARAVERRRHHQQLADRRAGPAAPRAPAPARDRHRASAHGIRRTAPRQRRRATGSSSTSRVNTPSVTTSMRVRFDIFEPKRTRRPTVSPTCSPSVAAMRAAAARAASRRGSSTQDLFVLRPRLVEQHQRHARGLAGAGRRHQHGGIVVRNAAVRSGSASSIGSGVENAHFYLLVDRPSECRVRGRRSRHRPIRAVRATLSHARGTADRLNFFAPARRSHRRSRAAPLPRRDRCCADRPAPVAPSQP